MKPEGHLGVELRASAYGRQKQLLLYSKPSGWLSQHTEQGRKLDSDDILLWQDGFWCFREELSPKFLRDDSYRNIVCGSDEWLRIISSGRHLPSSPG